VSISIQIKGVVERKENVGQGFISKALYQEKKKTNTTSV
tara:strand:+ start:1192 stop:1308 length:117 start_codon:yes stop_codon:yes gene_type:complete